MGSGITSSRVRICWMTEAKSAPRRSSLFTKAMAGTWYFLHCCHTVPVWASTPPTAHRITTAPSSTLNERSTSMVKSTWPGVSMIWICVILPFTGGHRGGDGDAPFLFLGHPVHGRLAVVYLAHAVDLAGIEEHPLRHGCLAGIDVGDEPDISHPGQVLRLLSETSLLLLYTKINVIYIFHFTAEKVFPEFDEPRGGIGKIVGHLRVLPRHAHGPTIPSTTLAVDSAESTIRTWGPITREITGFSRG